jgi:flagellar biosynthesis GTPase FlhF
MLNFPTQYVQGRHPALSPDQVAFDLAQARHYQKTRPDQADAGYQQVEEALLELAEQQNVQPLTSPTLLREHKARPETLQQEALRQRISEVYVEHGEVLEKLNQAEQAQACHRQAQAWNPARATTPWELSLPAAGPRFSLGRQAFQLTYCVSRAELAALKGLLKQQKHAVIEVMGPVGVGKTTLLQNLSHPHPDPFFQGYDLLAWIDCRSVSAAHADIQAISHTLGQSHLNLQRGFAAIGELCETTSPFVVDIGWRSAL